MNDLLKRYDEIELEILNLKTEQEEIKDALKRHVADHGEVSGYGWKATIKAGRKSTDHQAAVIDADVPVELLDKHTKVKPVTAWAKITKEAGLDLSEYTTQGEPSFVIQVLK